MPQSRTRYDVNIGDVKLGGISAQSPGSIEAKQSGKVTLTGEVTAGTVLTQLLRGDDLGAARLSPTGKVTTPFGDIELP